MADWEIKKGECRTIMDEEIEDESIHTVMTSPPYFGLRDYGEIDTVWGETDSSCDHAWEEDKRGETCSACGAWRGQLGLEPIHDCGSRDDGICSRCFVCHLVEVFRKVHDVLREDGTLWLNIGDSYSSGGRTTQAEDNAVDTDGQGRGSQRPPTMSGIKDKDMLGIPWRVALALQNDGWYLRSSIIWAKGVSGEKQIKTDLDTVLKKNGISKTKRMNILNDVESHVGNVMPESVKDRPVSSHEHIFLLSKSEEYFYDHIAVREELRYGQRASPIGYNDSDAAELVGVSHKMRRTSEEENLPPGRNQRDVWTINTGGFSDAHFAVFPPGIVEPCIKAGTSAEGACPECGAPYRRVTSREEFDEDDVEIRPETHSRHRTSIEGGQRLKSATSITVGWTSTCECDTRKSPSPCRVLDPFVGSGTTVMTALDLDRAGIGIEISDEYADMAEERVEKHLRDRLSPIHDEDYPEPEETEEPVPTVFEKVDS